MPAFEFTAAVLNELRAFLLWQMETFLHLALLAVNDRIYNI